MSQQVFMTLRAQNESSVGEGLLRRELIACALALLGLNSAGAGEIPILASSGQPEASDTSGETEYRTALSLNEQGKGKEALPILERLKNRFPDVLRYRLDYIAVASASGEHAAALAQMDGTLEMQAPRYVIEALFRSALSAGDEGKSELLHALLEKRFGADAGADIRLTHLYLQIKQYDKAQALSAQLLEKFPHRQDVLDLRAYTLRQSGRPAEALQAYEELKRLYPDNREAPKAIAMILAEMGGPQEGTRNVERESIALTTEESLRLATDRAAQYLHWALGDRNTPEERFTNADRAIAVLTAALDQGTAKNMSPATQFRIRRDLAVAYHARNRWQDSVAEYERLVAAGDAVPIYVSLPAASSYASLRRYAEAEVLLHELAEKSPDSLDVGQAWFYALSDLERYDDAQRVIDDLVQRLARRSRTAPGEASAYTAALIAQAMLSAYRSRLAAAQEKLDAVQAAAPGSLDAREAAGTLAMWRGHPRRAEEQFRLVLDEQPERLESRIALANARMDRGDAPFFRRTVNELAPGYPELRSIIDAKRRLELHDRYHVLGSVSFGGDQYSIAGNRTHEFDLKVYSPPFSDDRWRAFAHYRNLWSGPVVPASSDGVSAGLKYTLADWTTEVEAGSAGYARVETDYSLSDRWSASATVEKNMFFRQARAVEAGVTVDTAALGLRWRQDETRDVSAGYRFTSFSDNNRAEAYIAASQNLFTDFDRRLTAGARLAGQRNSNPDVAYFSPGRQVEASGTLTFEFMQWRDVETKKSSLWHRLWVTAGQVSQAGFGALPMSNFGYGQDIALSDAFHIRWSVSRTRYPFDGVSSSYYTGNISFEGYF